MPQMPISSQRHAHTRCLFANTHKNSDPRDAIAPSYSYTRCSKRQTQEDGPSQGYQTLATNKSLTSLTTTPTQKRRPQHTPNKSYAYNRRPTRRQANKHLKPTKTNPLLYLAGTPHTSLPHAGPQKSCRPTCKKWVFPYRSVHWGNRVGGLVVWGNGVERVLDWGGYG